MDSAEIQKYVIWGVAGLFGFALYSEVAYKRQGSAPRTFTEGQDVDVAITLVTTDAKALACSHAEEINGRHCEYASRTDRWSKPPAPGRTAAADTLAPYKTTDDILLLIPALFGEPALRERLAIDPPNFNAEHIRFVANCKLHVEGKLNEVDVRWTTNGQWQTQNSAWYGPVTGCWLSDG
ncbi:MAG TPA: hypothetical protein VK540_28040 [Polyangiaceae bacterium]|nr:hypothetical protein [Polyangiaceae bacterium]